MESSHDENNVYYSSVDQKLQRGSLVVVKDPKKVGEGRDSYIAYHVEIDGHGVTRRYSDFESLRDALARACPYCVLPPLPEKLPVAMASLGGSKNVEGSEVIEKRRRRLQSFLNRLATHPILSVHRMFLRFLEAETWFLEETEKAAQTGFLSNLSVSDRKVQKPDPRFVELYNEAHTFGQHAGTVDRSIRRLTRRHQELATDYVELTTVFSTFALTEKDLTPALEKFGAACDNVFLASRFLSTNIEETYLEPLQDHLFYVDATKAALARRDQDQATVEYLGDQISSKRTQLRDLETEAAGGKVETSMFKSFTSSISKMMDSNPEQTRKDNIGKLQTSIAQLEQDTEKANTSLLKNSEAVVIDIHTYEKVKAREMKELMAVYVRAQIEYYQKMVQAWGFVIPVLEEIPDKITPIAH